MNSFPPGYLSRVQPDGAETGPGWGWGSFILGDLDQAPLLESITFTRDIHDPVNAAPRTRVVPVFHCSSEVFQGQFTVNDDGGNPLADVAHGSYVGVNGNGDVSDVPETNDGAFLRNRVCRAADFIDGLSATFQISERATRMSFTTWTGAVPDGTVPSQLDPTNTDEAIALVLGHCGPDAPNDPAATDADALSSFHPQGAHFLLGDGSVRLIGSSISLPVYHALASRAGKDVVGEF